MIIIAAGTGIAAFISYLRGLLINELVINRDNKILVIFGNRNIESDFYYK